MIKPSIKKILYQGRFVFILLIIIFLVYFFIYFPKQQTNLIETERVVKVIDGDTVKLENGEKVRYIGIDAPELKTNECFAQEAKRENEKLVEGKIIKLKKDVSEKDSYGRLLRYVWKDNLFINLYLVKNGFAVSSTYPPDLAYADLINQAEKKAKEERKGLWSACR